MRIKLLWTFFLLTSFLSAESLLIQKLGMEKGLSNSYIVGITQDRQGFLWFATESGLNRFDGNNFRIYRKTNHPFSSINSNELNFVLADKTDDIIWIATQRTGLNAFNIKTEKFTYYTNDPNNPNSIVTNDITKISLARNNNLWISTYHGGVDYFDKKTGKFRHFNQRTIPGFVSNHVWCASEDNHGNLFVGHVFDGLSIINIKTPKFIHFMPEKGNPFSLPGVEVLSIFTDKEDRTWIGTNNGLALFIPETKQFISYRNIPGNPNSLSDNRVTSINQLHDNKLWIGTGQGINILDINQNLTDPSQLIFQKIGTSDDESGLSGKLVHDIIQDSFRNIWIGTYGGGINVISNNKPFFNNWTYNPVRGAQNSLSRKVAWSVEVDNNNYVWIGTDGGGIDKFYNKQKIKTLSKESGEIPNNFITQIKKDSDGNMWLCLASKDIFVYNITKNSIIHIPEINEDGGALCFFEDNHKTMWVGTYKGLYSYHIPSGQMKKYNSENSDLPDNSILSVSQDISGRIWVGTLGQGLAIFDRNFKAIEQLNLGNGFCSNAIHHIFRDSGNRMWVGTREGLVVFNPGRTKPYKVYQEKDGMAESYICAIAEGKTNHIWFSTNSGISHLYVKENKFDNFNYLDGIPRSNFMAGAVAKSKDGTLYFTSQNGVCFFNSEQKPPVIKPSTVTITEFRYYDKNISQPDNAFSLPVNSKISLNYHQNTFSLSFNVLDFGLKDLTEYSYMLKGLENSWYNPGNEKQVTFRNLPPGSYEFRVKSRLRNQVWSEEYTSMEITIHPPFWLTWWAKIIYFILIIWLLYYITRFYKRRLDLENTLYLEQKNHQQEQELNDERLRFYTNIAHELRTPLTLIIGPLEDLESDKTMTQPHVKKISLIHQSAIRLLKLINQILEFRKTETHNRNLCVVKGDLGALVKETGLKYEGLNQNSRVKFRFSIENKLPDLFFDPEIITIILDNLISNALKYTKKGEITISLRNFEENEQIYTEIEVKDTGFGISTDMQKKIFERYYQVRNEHHVSGSGIGLSLVKSLAEIHQGSISVESTPGTGSSFKFRILTNNQYPDDMHSEVSSGEKNADEIQSVTGKLMLIVEDNHQIREYIAGSFSDSFEILEAENGQNGLLIAQERIPDIIISDIMMPVMDGIELCKIIKEDMRTSHIPIILLTAKDSLQDKTEGYITGADSYITKPFSAALLQSRVTNLLEARKKMAALYASTSSSKQNIMTESLNKLDQEFMDKVTKIIVDHLDSEQINIAFIAEKMNMSHSTLYRKIKALTNISVNELIRKIKIQNAEKFLLSGKYTVSEITYMVGISSASYFRQCFRDEFGLSPTEYLKKIMEGKE